MKDIQNTEQGVYGFWMKAMLNHPSIAKLVQEKDRPILSHLTDISLVLHTDGFGYDLLFKFEANDYFTNTELKKSFFMAKQSVIEKCEGTTINWKEGKNVTEKKVKKKSKTSKGKETKIVE